jgi:hypothetical protein
MDITRVVGFSRVDTAVLTSGTAYLKNSSYKFQIRIYSRENNGYF